MRTAPSPTNPSNRDPSDVGRAGRKEGIVFQEQQAEAKPCLCTRASIQHPAGLWDWFLSLAGLGLARSWCLCMTCVCTGLSKHFVLKPHRAVSPECPQMMIPRVGDVSQPQMCMCGDSVEPGTAQAPDTSLGQFPDSGTCLSTGCLQVVIPRLGDTSQSPTSAATSGPAYGCLAPSDATSW